MSDYDVVVLGLGGMGSAAAAHLAARGKRVLGLEQFALGHDFGASSGRSRVIRKAYFESPEYVPLLVRAYELWRELETRTQTTLLDLTGVLMVGEPGGTLMEGVRRSVELHGVEVEELDRAGVHRRFPQAKLERDECALFEPEAGAVFPELAIAAQLQVARAHGADLRDGVTVSGWHREQNGAITVVAANGAAFTAQHLVLCAGPWLGRLATDLALPITIQRNVQIWFEPQTRTFDRGRFPTFFLERRGLPATIYGFPDFGDGVKAALHSFGEATTAATLDREIHPSDIDVVKTSMDAFLPGAAGAFRFGKACMYALTPDEHFIIDRHPLDDGIVIAGGFSGHGFKFCPVVGEIIADFVDGIARPDLAFLSLRRFARAKVQHRSDSPLSGARS